MAINMAGKLSVVCGRGREIPPSPPTALRRNVVLSILRHWWPRLSRFVLGRHIRAGAHLTSLCHTSVCVCLFVNGISVRMY